jgi:glyceraldehyde-3-phosphate dehydrogenase/erythrose-4-phosphate dehydrogenase
MKKNVLIIGTGTIGEPLIGLLSDLKNELGINVLFHKRTPLIDEWAKVESLCARGAKLVVDGDRHNEFLKLRHKPEYDYESAMENAHVIIDCTPAGNQNKETIYSQILEGKLFSSKNRKRLFIAQGSERNFGLPYAYGINDSALTRSTPNFVQVVSCNTHNICSILKSLSPNFNNILNSDFTCIRRANDISQQGNFIASPQVGAHGNKSFGTHHAADASRVLETMYHNIPMYSSAMKVNSQYMHIIRFNVEISGHHDAQSVTHMFRENKFVALTYKDVANKVFSFGRDHGYYGRIFNQTVVSLPSLSVINLAGTTKITGFCFTPQDGNSLLSSIAAALYGIHGEKYMEKMQTFDKYLFSEI